MDGQPRRAGTEEAERLHRFAHDIRNRLTGLKQVLEQLAAATADPDPELLDFAESQYFKALREVESLLDDRGVDRGMGEPHKEPQVLADLVRRSVEDLAHRFQRKEQRVDLDVDGAVIVPADARHIVMLIGALLSNASKFSPSGSVIYVRGTREEGMAVLRVRDQGVGLDAEDQRDLFTRYALLKSRSTDGEAQGRGTLARAREWAAAHGGSLDARSDGPGLGMEFILRLPY